MGREQLGTPLIPLPKASEFGPAMRALPTDGQRRFVIAVLELGTTNYGRAALMAGYSSSTLEVLRVTGDRLAHDAKIAAAIHEESLSRLHAGKVMAVSTLLTIAEKGAKDGDRLKAVDMILNRTGMHSISETHVKTQDVSRTEDAMIERITALCKTLNLDPAALLGARQAQLPPPEVVDAEFTEHSSEGLEDLL